MSYEILIKRQAQKKLKSLPKDERLRLAEKIIQLGNIRTIRRLMLGRSPVCRCIVCV